MLDVARYDLALDEFIELAGAVIDRAKREALIDGITYKPIGDGAYYAQELFEEQELTGYLTSMVEDSSEEVKSVYEHVVYDSNVEKSFAHELMKHSAVKVFAKLPDWFRVPTPLGSYNPDWEVVIEEDGRGGQSREPEPQ